MKAMLLEKIGEPMKLRNVPKPIPKAHQVLVKVTACGVCRTDLHIVDGELSKPKLPLIPGHQIVGTVEARGTDVQSISIGSRVGVPWLGGCCGHCEFCLSKRENLCDNALYTGYQIDGGFAEYCVADARFCFSIAESYSDMQAAPLLCAGLIGYRALSMTGDAKRIGFYGFGASAHILTQVVTFQGKEVYAFTREGDVEAQSFALKLGATWAGTSTDTPPNLLDAAIIFAPVGDLLPLALKQLKKGGRLVCAGIHMSAIPSFPYSLLWEERSIQSVANLTRQDGHEFLDLAPQIPVKTSVTSYSLEEANEALADLRKGRLTGAAVIRVAHP
jgi:propanol-preferring alcohol dehydrogenase